MESTQPAAVLDNADEIVFRRLVAFDERSALCGDQPRKRVRFHQEVEQPLDNGRLAHTLGIHPPHPLARRPAGHFLAHRQSPETVEVCRHFRRQPVEGEDELGEQRVQRGAICDMVLKAHILFEEDLIGRMFFVAVKGTDAGCTIGSIGRYLFGEAAGGFITAVEWRGFAHLISPGNLLPAG